MLAAHNKLQEMKDREWKDLRENNEWLRNKIDEMWKEWRAERQTLQEVLNVESEKLRQEMDEKTQLRTENEKLCAEVKKVSDQLKVVLSLLAAVLGNNSSSSEVSYGVHSSLLV